MIFVRDRILALFEKHRRVPGAAYEEAHFLDYLVPNPGNKKQIRHLTYGGRKRYHSFVEETQDEFAICFSQKDYDANHSLERFVARVEELQESTRASLASLKNQMNADHGEKVMFYGTIFVCGLASPFVKDQAWRLYALGAFVVLFNGWLLVLRAQGKAYEARLLAKIESRKNKA